MPDKDLKTLIYERGVGGRDEHWWYLCFSPNDGNFYIEHQWDYAGYKGQADNRGSEKITLSEVKEKYTSVYRKAIAVLQERLFIQDDS